MNELFTFTTTSGNVTTCRGNMFEELFNSRLVEKVLFLGFKDLLSAILSENKLPKAVVKDSSTTPAEGKK